MRDQREYYDTFAALHQRPGVFIVANVWDGGSALLAKAAGFEALATSSAALAVSLGRLDGRHAVSRDEHLEHGRSIVALTGLPLQGDTEDGFGSAPGDPGLTVDGCIAAGFAGLSIEDTTGDADRPLHDFDTAVTRIAAAATRAKGKIVLTARTDNLLHDIGDIDETVRRLVAFAEAGADVLYAPALPDARAIRTVVGAVAPKPVSVLLGADDETLSLDALADLGVKRVTLGSAPYRHALKALAAGYAAAAAGDVSVIAGGYSSGRLSELTAAARGT